MNGRKKMAERREAQDQEAEEIKTISTQSNYFKDRKLSPIKEANYNL